MSERRPYVPPKIDLDADPFVLDGPEEAERVRRMLDPGTAARARAGADRVAASIPELRQAGLREAAEAVERLVAAIREAADALEGTDFEDTIRWGEESGE